MNLDWRDIVTFGPALPEPFLRFELEPVLRRLGLLTQVDTAAWSRLRHTVRSLGRLGGPQRVHNHVIAPLAGFLGYNTPIKQPPSTTREGPEDGGCLLPGSDIPIRTWSVGIGTSLDAPKRGKRADRFSPTSCAQRVLRASQERVGLLTDGDTLRLLLCDPHEPDSHLDLPLSGWDGLEPPDTLTLLAALTSPAGTQALPKILDAARLHQTGITHSLRIQARAAITLFLQAVLDRNPNHGADAKKLWAEGLVLVYRLLFILKLESNAEHAFSFALTPLWREALSPNQALGSLVRRRLDQGHETGRMLEDGLRLVFRIFRDGLTCGGLSIAPLGGALFGAGAMPTLEALPWGDQAVALLLDQLLWSTPKGRPRQRVHYGSLDVENLGHIYEALLELEPTITANPERFILRAGNGRKSTGSYYTPHSLVRFLVRETLTPLITAASPEDDPNPLAILRLRVVDPAAGSGHFLIEACRFLAEALYTACRLCDAGTEEHQARLAALEPTLLAWLPTHAVEGAASARALAICRRLVAVHCLYGVDRNPLAVELAKLALWLESHAEGLPLTFLDHRLIAGDSIAGPFLSDLARLPVGGQQLDPLLARGMADRLAASLPAALAEVTTLDASIGRDVGDLGLKEEAKIRLDTTLAPLRLLAQAWSGAVALGERDCDDEWQALAASVAATGTWPGTLRHRQRALLAAGSGTLPWDLTFPEVFQCAGFDAVLSNPPWDVIQYHADDGDKEQNQRQKRLAARLFPRRTAANLDAFQLFAERFLDLGRSVGALLPSAFHANESAAYTRRRYFTETTIACCYTFENRRKLFDIDSRFKFSLVIARAPGPTQSMRCAFYLAGIDELSEPGRVMEYDSDFMALSAGSSLVPLELRGAADMAVARVLFRNRMGFAAWCDNHGIRFGCDLHMTADAGCFLPPCTGEYTLQEGKTFHQFTDQWGTKPRYSVSAEGLRRKPGVARVVGYHRLAFRDIARATDERTMIATILPPGSVCGHTATVEKHPDGRNFQHALILCAVMNSYVFDWLTRQKAATHLSLHLLAGLPMPTLSPDERQFLADGTSRLLRGTDWAVRARMDATIAHAYGLDRAAYARVLESFNHRSCLHAPSLCLPAFDEISL